MDEQKFIYGKLKYLEEQIGILTELIEKQQVAIETLTGVITKNVEGNKGSNLDKLHKNLSDMDDKKKMEFIRKG